MIWQRARVLVDSVNQVIRRGDLLWVLAEPPHRIQGRGQHDSSARYGIQEAYHTNILDPEPIGPWPWIGIPARSVELLPEFADDVEPGTLDGIAAQR